MTPIRIPVSSERTNYAVVIGCGLAGRLPQLLKSHKLGSRWLVVSTPPIWRHQGQRLRGLIPDGDAPALMPDGERAKTLRSVATLYEACVDRRLDRAGGVIAFGGGVVGDVAGFAAASYLRGITLVQVPTTLLAQVDSAIGGKVGVNLTSGKNLVGAFHAPSLVVCDPDLLSTLSAREFRAGLYEVVKYGVIASPALFDSVSQSLDAIVARDARILTSVIGACCRIKADVVMSDERESGPRRVLNFGHTIGHALEALTSYRRFRHGEAIGHGMLAAARLSALRGALSGADEARIAGLVAALGPLPPVQDLRASDALDVIARDKKVVKGRLHVVLATGIGRTAIVGDITERELTRAMLAIGMRP